MTFQTNFKSDLPTIADDKIAAKALADAKWRSCCKIVDGRDHRRCRACLKRTDPNAIGLQRAHRHHMERRGASGPNESWNVITLCAVCHPEVKAQRLRVEGNADDGAAFWKKGPDGKWYLWKREIAPFVVERD